MAKGYCNYSYTYVPFLGSDTYYCLSKNHPKYKSGLEDWNKSREMSSTYYREFCNTEKCFQCVNYMGAASYSPTINNQPMIFCRHCGQSTATGRFCSHCGGQL